MTSQMDRRLAETRGTAQTIMPPGAIFLASNGAYSDYYIIAVYRVLHDLDIARERKVYLSEHPELKNREWNSSQDEFPEEKFLALLESRGIIGEVPHYEVHFGDGTAHYGPYIDHSPHDE